MIFTSRSFFLIPVSFLFLLLSSRSSNAQSSSSTLQVFQVLSSSSSTGSGGAGVGSKCNADGQDLAEGQAIDRYPFWFVCRKGAMVPGGCLTDAEPNRRVNVGDVWQTTGYELRCTEEPDHTSVRMEATACIHDGKRYTDGQTYQDKFFWYSCVKLNGKALAKQIGGCVDESGGRVAPGGTVQGAEYVYECRKSTSGSSESLQFAPVSCVKDGKKYRIGESFASDRFWYKCSNDAGGITLKLSGCVTEEGRQIAEGEKYYKGGFVYECQMDHVGSRTRAGHVVVGCIPFENNESIDSTPGAVVSSEGEKKIGETWLSGKEPFQYRLLCEKTDQSVKQTLIKCHYKGAEGEVELDPGCFRTVGNLLVTCSQRSEGLNMSGFLKDSNPPLDGFRKC